MCQEDSHNNFALQNPFTVFGRFATIDLTCVAAFG